MTSGDHGYEGLLRALALSPEDVVARLEKVGVTEIAGGGSVAGAWERCRAAEAEEKCVVCNAVSAAAQGQIAEVLLSRDAHAVLEGLLIAAYATGATQLYMFVAAEKADQIATITAAVEEMREQGLLRATAPGAGFSCELMIVPVTASLILREETALLRVLEGRQAIPYLATSGAEIHRLHGRPTVVHGAETLAHVASVFREPLQGAGIDSSTRLLAVQWSAETKVVEVPIDASVRTVVRETLGVDLDGDQVKAVRFGGSTGRFLAGSSLETSLGCTEIGMLEVIGSGACGVELARDALHHLREESCGACVACREGMRQVVDMLDDIVAFEAEAESMALLAELAEALAEGSMCFVGEGAAAALLSTMELFPVDYGSHLEDKRCRGDENRA
jgi:NADH-quinone oxidoreductase subunit F